MNLKTYQQTAKVLFVDRFLSAAIESPYHD